jgi:hypothetical protein
MSRYACAVLFGRQRHHVCLRVVEQIPSSMVHGQQWLQWPGRSTRGCRSSKPQPRNLASSLSSIRRRSSVLCAPDGVVRLHKESDGRWAEAPEASTTSPSFGVLWMARDKYCGHGCGNSSLRLHERAICVEFGRLQVSLMEMLTG